MKAKDIELIRVLSGIEHPDHKKDYGYEEEEAPSHASARVIGEALETVAGNRPVRDIDDTLLEHQPLKTRKKKFKGRLHALEEKVEDLMGEVTFLREQLGLTAHRRTTPADLVEDWDQTLHGGLTLGDSPLGALPALHRKSSQQRVCSKKVVMASVAAKPDDLFDEEDIPLILSESEARPDPPVGPPDTTPTTRFSGLDLEDEATPTSPPMVLAHPRFSGLCLED